MSNPFMLSANPNADLSDLASQPVPSAPLAGMGVSALGAPGLLPPAVAAAAAAAAAAEPVKDEPIPVKEEPELPKVVHIFVTAGSCYDQAGYRPGLKGQVRFVVPPETFDTMDHPKVKQFLTLIHRGVFPVVDVSCCSWVDTCSTPKGLFDFLEFVMSRNGTVRFSDFSLRIARDFLERVGLGLDYKLVPDLNGTVKIEFDPEDLKASRLDDLQLLGELAMEGTVSIHAMGGTRRMFFEKELPSHVKALVHLNLGTTQASPPGGGIGGVGGLQEPLPKEPKRVPALLLLSRPETSGRVILFSCHFAEMQNVQGVDPDRVVSAIRLRQGEEAAREFQERLERARASGGEESASAEASGGVAYLVSAASPSCEP